MHKSQDSFDDLSGGENGECKKSLEARIFKLPAKLLKFAPFQARVSSDTTITLTDYAAGNGGGGGEFNVPPAVSVTATGVCSLSTAAFCQRAGLVRC